MVEFDVDAARKILKAAGDEIAATSPGSQLLTGGMIVLETVDLEDGEPYITVLTSDSNEEPLTFWRMMGFARYVDADCQNQMGRRDT